MSVISNKITAGCGYGRGERGFWGYIYGTGGKRGEGAFSKKKREKQNT